MSEICDYGESKYFNMVYTLCSVGADLKWQLNDIGIDYTQISDFKLFYTIIAKKYNALDTTIFFGNVIDFSKMHVCYDKELKEPVLVQLLENNHILKVDKFTYISIVNILRKMHKLKRNDELPGNESTRKILIEDARDEYLENKDKPYKSYLLPLISTMVNSEGFKRDDITVFDMKISAFMDSVSRVSKIKNAELLLQSGYSGFGIDLKKINKEDLNYIGELD